MEEKNRTFKVLFPHEFPAVSNTCSNFPHLRSSPRCPYPGLIVEILIAIADSINVPIEEVLVEDDVNQDGNLVLGTVDGNNVSGLLRYVHEGIVDTIAYPIQKTIVRSQYMDFSEALYQSELNILRRRVDISEESLWSFFTIYDKPSYVVMAVILSLQALFYLINEFCAEELQRIGFRHIRAMRRHSESLWNAVKLQLGMPIEVSWRSYGAKFNMVFVSIFQGVILMGVYSSWILTQKYANDIVNDLQTNNDLIRQVAAGRRYFADATGNHWFFEAINHSTMFPYADLRLAMRKTPMEITGSSKNALDLASHGSALVAIMDDELVSLRAKKYCNLIPMDHPMAVVTAHLVFAKNNSLLPLIDEAIRINQLQFQRIVRRYLDYGYRVHKSCVSDGMHTKAPYFGLCLVWLALVGCAFGLFLAELSTYWLCMKVKLLRNAK